jgi:hypothetical protein
MTNNDTMQMLAAKEAKRQYHREWRKNNPDRVKASQQRYWAKKGREYLEALEKESSQ